MTTRNTHKPIAMQYTHPSGKVVRVNYHNAEPKKFQVFYSFSNGQRWAAEAATNDPAEWWSLCRRNGGANAYEAALVVFVPIVKAGK